MANPVVDRAAKEMITSTIKSVKCINKEEHGMVNPAAAIVTQELVTSTIKSAESLINNWQKEKTKRKEIEAELTARLEVINKNYKLAKQKIQNDHEKEMLLLNKLTELLTLPNIQEKTELYSQTLTTIANMHAQSLNSNNIGAIEGSSTKFIGQSNNSER